MGGVKSSTILFECKLPVMVSSKKNFVLRKSAFYSQVPVSVTETSNVDKDCARENPGGARLYDAF